MSLRNGKICSLSELLLLIILISSGDMLFAATDSLKSNNWNRYFYISDPFKDYDLDTSLVDFQIYNPVYKRNRGQQHLGNLGSPHFPSKFELGNKPGFDVGLHQMDLYRFSQDSVPYFKTEYPVSELGMNLGLNEELMFSVMHSQPVKQQFDFGFNLLRLSSKGIYQRQRATHTGMNFNGRYKSINGQYELIVSYLFNTLKNQENGGVLFYGLFEDTSFTSKEILDVQLDNASNEIKHQSIYIQQALNFGETIDRRINDSTSIKTLMPKLRIYHEIELFNDNNRYKDLSILADTSYYSDFYQSGQDTQSFDLFYRGWDFELGLQSTGIKKNDSVSIYRNFLFSTSANFRPQDVYQGFVHDQLYNLQVNGGISSNPLKDSRLNYFVSASFNLMDYNQGDYSIRGGLSYNLNKWGLIKGEIENALTTPDWMKNNYSSRSLNWDNNFTQTKLLRAKFAYYLDKYQFRTSVTYHNLVDHVYWNKEYKPENYNDILQVMQIGVRKRFSLNNKWHLDNKLSLQFSTNDQVTPIPLFSAWQSWYFTSDLFEGALSAMIGFDIYYQSNYYAPAYFPLTGQFSSQDQRELKYYPVMDLFLQVFIKRAKVFAKMTNLNQGMFKQKGYFSALHYPMKDRTFTAGLSWRFFR